MAKTTCKLCFRRFPSPRALAGHMRSHSIAVTQAAAAAAEAAAAVKQQISSASSASTSIAAAYEDLASKMPAASAFGLPKRGADASFSDRESEAESTPPHAKRVKAVAAAAAAWAEAEPVSSLSEQVATPEEDVAMSLMMLSRDSWPSAALGDDDDYDGYSDEGSDDGYAPPAPPLTPAAAPVTARRPPALVEKRTQFPCVACKKVFRSYQALGGHRASNVRGGRGGCLAPPVAPHPLPPPPQQPAEPEASPQQASTAAAAASTSTTAAAAADPSPINNNASMIDLNVAPPSEEVEVSAVSDPRFNP